MAFSAIESGGMSLAAAVAGGIAKEPLVAFGTKLLRWARGDDIEIKSPTYGASLSRKLDGRWEYDHDDWSYEVSGRLRDLPENHEILLIVHDPSRRLYWPQLWNSVQYQRNLKSWKGRVLGTDFLGYVFAVVAPPSWMELARYYEKLSRAANNWSQMSNLPNETINMHKIQVRFP